MVTNNHFENGRDLLGTNNIFLAKVVVWVLLLVIGVHSFFADTWWQQLLGAVLAPLMMAHGVELQHQALHNAGFRSRRVNRVVGFFLGLPLLISFAHYQDRHLHHHQNVGTSQDSEFFQYSKENNHQTLRLVANLLMLSHWWRVGGLMVAAVMNGDLGKIYNKHNRAGIRTDYVLFLFVLTALLMASIAQGNLVGLKVIALVLLAAPVHTLLELPEHSGCDRCDDVLKNTRSIRSNRLMTWFTNGNNYHVEHHLSPNVIPERLHILHQRIQPKIAFQNDSYFEFIASLFKPASERG